MIEVKNITKKFGDFTAIEDLNICIDSGSIFGLVGYNGAGKTTLLKSIAGVYKPDSGLILFDGKNTYIDAPCRCDMFYVPDDIFFLPFATIEKMGQFYSGYYKNFSFDILTKLCDVFGLDKKQKLNGFSKGMQRQAEVILALSCQPKLLLLDESFDGLDPSKRNIMNNMIVEYSSDKNCTVIISSHNLHEISDVCDHVALLNGKRIMMNCSVDDISENRCKFRLVFSEEKNKDDFNQFNVKKFKGDGKIITISLAGDVLENEEKLRSMNPLLVEKFPLTLEEIFLEEMEEKDYDFKEIFS